MKKTLSVLSLVLIILGSFAMFTACEDPAAPTPEKPAPVVKYTVTFETAIGTAPAKVVVEKDKTTDLPALKDANNTFLGWLEGDKIVESPYKVTKDVKLVAKWVALPVCYAAPLKDTSVPEITDLYAADSYKVSVVATADDTFNISVAATDLKFHNNGQVPPVFAAWAGFSLKAPEGATGFKFVTSKEADITAAEINALEPAIDQLGGTEEGVAFYNAVDKKINRYYQVQWFNAEETAVSNVLTFNVDYSNVKLKEYPLPTFYAAPLADAKDPTFTDLYDEGSYKVSMLATAMNQFNVFVEASNLKFHFNPIPEKAAWAGFSLKAPEGATGFKLNTDPKATITAETKVNALEPAIDKLGGTEEGVAFYNRVQINPTRFYQIQWVGKENAAIGEVLTFNVDFSKVTVVYPSPLYQGKKVVSVSDINSTRAALTKGNNIVIQLTADLKSTADDFKFTIDFINDNDNFVIDLNGCELNYRFDIRNNQHKKNNTVNIINTSEKQATINSPQNYGVLLFQEGDNNNVINIENIVSQGPNGGVYSNGTYKGNAVFNAKNCSFFGTATTNSSNYLAADNTYNFENCSFKAATALYTKAGVNNFKTCNFEAVGPKTLPTHNGNGADETGSAVVVDSAKGYECKDFAVTLDNCTFTSANNLLIEEFKTVGKNETEDDHKAFVPYLKQITVKGTTMEETEFSSENNKIVFE